MLLNLEQYHRPKSLAQALALLTNTEGRIVVPIAGGTRLVASGRRDVQDVVDISHLGLSYIRSTDHSLVIGATTTLQTLVESPECTRTPYAIVSQAARSTTTSKMLRNVSTVGGELATRSPYSDLTTALLALNAALVIARNAEPLTILPLAQFLSQPHHQGIPSGLITEIRLPHWAPTATSAFLRLSQIPSSPPILNAAALVSMEAGRCHRLQIALGAAEGVPVRLTLAEALLEGQIPELARIDAAVEKAVEHLQPFSDTHASADYRKTVAAVLARRVLHACLGDMPTAR